ncbi:MAG: hypothetical protein F7C34_00980 [Desulfurococcales archaeon]|nr:hypothetical protein [Desulfurococcales archaeon]
MFHKLTKRELAAYALLASRAKWNIGEAVDAVSRELCTTKRTARRIVKRLRRLGLVSVEARNSEIVVRPVDPSRVLSSLLEEYAEQRRRKCYALAKRPPPEGRSGVVGEPHSRRPHDAGSA